MAHLLCQIATITIHQLKSLPYVEYVDKNFRVQLDHTEPNDEYFSQQWALKNVQSRGNPERPETTPYCDIHAPEAWDISTGNPDVVVAVLDTGIFLNHIDLAANIWTNPNDSTEDELDNDENGFEDDNHGWDFTTPNGGDNEPDDWGVYHGTSVAGILGAKGNNGEGISGVSWNVKIMPLKISDIQSVVNAIDYATMNGAYILNGSISYDKNNTESEPISVKYAISRASKKSKLYVCSAGNYTTGQDIDKLKNGLLVHPSWPSNWTLDNILSVLATKYVESSDEEILRSDSNYGGISVDIGAPGTNIYTTWGPDYTYTPFNGTSAATPHVAGVAALALGVSPGLTFGRLKSLILQNDDNFSSLSGKCVSGGRVNAKKVLAAIGGTIAPNAPSNLSAYPKAWTVIQLAWNDNSNNELGFEIQRRDNYQANFIHDNCSDMNSTSTVLFRDETINNPNPNQRTFEYRVRATNRAGASAFSNIVSGSVPYTVPEAPNDLLGNSPAVYPLVNIYWSNHAVNALNNFVERRIPGYADWEVIATLGYDADAYSDPSALPGYTYEYRIRAWNPLGYSGYSNIIAIEVIVW